MTYVSFIHGTPTCGSIVQATYAVYLCYAVTEAYQYPNAFWNYFDSDYALDDPVWPAEQNGPMKYKRLSFKRRLKLPGTYG